MIGVFGNWYIVIENFNCFVNCGLSFCNVYVFGLCDVDVLMLSCLMFYFGRIWLCDGDVGLFFFECFVVVGYQIFVVGCWYDDVVLLVCSY